MAPRFLRRFFDRLVQAEEDTIAVESFDMQAMRDRADELSAENDRLCAAISSAVAILDPHTTDPWAYEPGTVPQHAEVVRSAVDVLVHELTEEVASAAVQLGRVRGVVECATGNEIGSLVLLAELRHILDMPSSVNGAAA